VRIHALGRGLAVKKYDIINALGRRYGLRRYLEICTPTTGHTYALVDGAWFEPKHRLVYNCPENADDGLDYTYRTVLQSSHEILRTVAKATDGNCRYDLIFVDPFHTLQSSSADIAAAWKMLSPDGILVVHDCNPADEAMTAATFQPGNWCGLTYRAYIDFVFSQPARRYCTVDTDYGCGVVHKRASKGEPVLSAIDKEQIRLLRLQWQILRESEETRYSFFDRHRVELLQLVSVERFVAMEGLQ
jgi:hypothetical protein